MAEPSFMGRYEVFRSHQSWVKRPVGNGIADDWHQRSMRRPHGLGALLAVSQAERLTPQLLECADTLSPHNESNPINA